jgi:hypothetical protein
MKKRFNIYKRDKVGLVCEVFVPFLMVLVGCCITQVSLINQAPPRNITPLAYPQNQPILMNQENVINSGDSDISPQTLFENLPGTQHQFDVSYVENVTYEQFYNKTFESRHEYWPYSYGSYQVFKADNKSK